MTQTASRRPRRFPLVWSCTALKRCLVAGLFTVPALAALALDRAVTHPQLVEAVRWYTGVAGTMNNERAATLLEKALADEDTLAVMWLARVHSTGRMGYVKDRPRARALATTVIDAVERLAATGNEEAMFLMGTAYAEGLGKRKNAKEAVQWYRRAAATGHVLASHNLGNALAAGKGIGKNKAEAVRWWRLAAEAGDAVTQYRLGEALERGRGVERDRKAALRWYKTSAARGYGRASRALARLARRHRGR